jgi:hypothetical protein
MKAAILDFRPAARQDIRTTHRVRPDLVRGDLVRLFALNRPPLGPRRLVCRWRRDTDGHLTAHWEL